MNLGRCVGFNTRSKADEIIYGLEVITIDSDL